MPRAKACKLDLDFKRVEKYVRRAPALLHCFLARNDRFATRHFRQQPIRQVRVRCLEQPLSR
jgi:hypothetical protein